jgi:16S rRNA G966 N2-methylase RsmD
MEAFRETFMKYIRPDIHVMRLDAVFNDPPYAEAILKLFDEMMSK